MFQSPEGIRGSSRYEIEGTFFEELKKVPSTNKSLFDTMADIETNILPELSEDFVKENEVLDPFLLDRTVKHWERNNREQLMQKLQDAMDGGDFDTFQTLMSEYKPIQKDSKTKGFNALEVYSMEQKPTEWMIDDLLPKGLTIFAGRSKAGKSYMILNVLLNLVQGKPMFGEDEDSNYRGPRGSILYLALDDPDKRVQARIPILEPNPNTRVKNLEIRTEWKSLNKGGLSDMENWIKNKLQLQTTLQEKNSTKKVAVSPTVIVIDVIGKIWNMKTTTSGGRQYGEEYDIFGELADLAHKYNISIVALHHTTKTDQHDVFNNILGGMGTQGAADNLMILTRAPRNQRKLSLRCKDTGERHLMFEVRREGAQWICLGDEDEIQKTDQQQSLYDWINLHGSVGRNEIVQAAERGQIEVSANSVPVILRKMVQSGRLLQSKQYGKYTTEECLNIRVANKLNRNK